MDHETMGNSLQQVAAALEFGTGNSRLTLSEASASKQTTLVPKNHRVAVTPILGGLHHEYRLQEIAP